MLKFKSKSVKKVVAVVVFLSATFLSFKSAGALSAIDVVFNSDDYNYLPEVAKELIRENYEENGVVMPTERNKQPGQLYLNPEYVAYLTLNDEEKAKVGVVPMVYVVAEEEPMVETTQKSENKRGGRATEEKTGTAVEGIDKDEELPATFDLRNVNGNNYVTPLNNQGTLGLCWNFAFNEQIESLVMLNNNAPYNANTTQRFSVRQLDYATSNDGFLNYTNPDGSRALGEGGNYYMAAMIAGNGLALVDNSLMPYNLVTTKKEMADVLNYGNSLYELNRGIMLPKSSLSHENYIKYAKSGVMHYGGAEVATGSPDGSCGSMVNGNDFIYDEASCQADSNFGAHSMQIIGWDDNFEWSFCRETSTHATPTALGTCTSGELVSGTGAWLARNSWGTGSDGYVYIAYDSSRSNMQINFTTDISLMSERKWDNNYHINHWKVSPGAAGFNDSIAVEKKVPGAEKLEQVKFFPYTYNGQYKITATDGTNSYTLFNGTVVWPGLFTVDVSDQNIVINADSFTVSIESLNNKIMVKNSLQVFTSNIDTTPASTTADQSVDLGIFTRNQNTSFIIYTDTKNIPANATPTYKLYDGEKDITKYLSVTRNIVGANNINAYVNVGTDAGPGEFTLKICYQESCSDSKITITGALVNSGTGTVSNPYLLIAETDFDAMHYSPSSYFRLGRDLTFTKPFTPVGTASEPFTGGFSGENHKITNLTIDASGDCAGFLGYARTSSATHDLIKKLTLVNPTVTNTGDAGGFVGCLEVGDGSTTNIQSAFVIGGTIESSAANAGALVGTTTFAGSSNLLNIQDVYSSASVSGAESSGMFGNVGPSGGLTLTRAQNTGLITAKTKQDGTVTNYHSALVGHENNTTFNVTNYTTSALVKYGDNYNNDIVDQTNDSVANIWTVNEIDGVTRIPVLKKVVSGFTYSSIQNSMTLYQNDNPTSILGLFSPTMDAARITYSFTNNDDVIEISEQKDPASHQYPNNILASGLKIGSATMHVLTQYDGNERDVTVNVVGPVVTSGGSINETAGGIIVVSESTFADVTARLAASDSSAVTYTHLDVDNNTVDSDVIKTGDIARITIGGSHDYDYQLVVVGDIDGDGAISSGDYVKLRKHILGTETLVNTSPSYIAADFDGDGNVDSLDYVKMRRSIMDPDELSGITPSEDDGISVSTNTLSMNVGETATFTIEATNGAGRVDIAPSSETVATVSSSHVFLDSILTDDGSTTITVTGAGAGSTTINISVGDVASFNESAFPVAVYTINVVVEPVIIEGNGLTIGQNDILVMTSTNFQDLVSKANVGASTATYTHYDKDDAELTEDALTTGDKMEITIGENNYNFEIAVLGDVNRDGRVSSADYIKIRKHIMEVPGDIIENYSLTFYAADITGEGLITSRDYIKIKLYIMNGGVWPST